MGLRRLLTVSAASALAIATLPMSAAQSTESAPALDWVPCQDSYLEAFTCAILERPLDRARPNGAKIQIAMVKLPASGTPEQRVGTLFMNPGGPGGSGVEAAPYASAGLPNDVRESFDFVTWDPRGIGSSTPAIKDCTAAMPQRPSTGPVDWQQVLRGRVRYLGSVNRRCYAQNASLINHVGTVDGAYDLDAMRAAVGDERLTYWGISYGTMLGSTYAQLFPENVRALVLDGNMDPQIGLLRLSWGASATDNSIGYYFEVFPELEPKFIAVREYLNERAITIPGGTPYTRWDLLDTVAGHVAAVDGWPTARDAIESSYDAIFATGETQAAALAALQGARFRSPSTDSNAGVFSAILCQDFAGRPGRAQQRSTMDTAVLEGPLYGGVLAADFLAACSGYGRIKASPVPRPTAYGPNVPGLVVNSTRDAETPYQWAVNMARTYPSMRMVTSPSGLHGTFGLAQDACINDTVSDFLLSGVVPALDVVCPFTPPRD